MRIEDALERFIIQLQANGRSEHTIGQYRRHITLLAGWLARERPCVEFEPLDHGDIAKFMNSPVARQRPDGQPKKPTSMNALRTSLRTFFSYAHAAGWTRQNPARLVRRAICSPPPPRWLGDDEVNRLLAPMAMARNHIGERDHALFHLMVATGIRLSSALHLRVEDIDLERGEIVLNAAKGSRVEIVALGRKIRDHLASYLAGRRSGFLFTGPGGHPVSRRHAHRRLLFWLTTADISRRISPHALRHSFGMSLYRKSRDLLLVQRALGHRSIVSTLIYAHASSDDVRRALA